MSRLNSLVERAVPVLVLLVCVCGLVYEGVSGSLGLVAAAIGIAAGWIVVGLKLLKINTYALVSGICFGAAGLACLIITDAEFWHSVFVSQAEMLKYILLYGSVIWLRVQAQNSRSLGQLSQWLLQASARQKRLGLPMLGHFMGAGFNLAGLGLITPVVDASPDANSQKRNFVSIIHGFSLATAWSPVFASIIVVLAAFPDLIWIDFAPWSLLAATGLFIVYQAASAVLAGKLRSDKQAIGQAAEPTSSPQFVPYQSLLIVGSLLVALVTSVLITGWPVTVVLGIVAPVFAFVWFKSSDSKGQQLVVWTASTLSGLGKLHSEIFVFAMANLLVVGVASLLDSGLISSIDTSRPALNWTIFAALYLVITIGGVHPLVFVLVGVQLFPASTLELSDITFAVLILTLWTSSTIGSPMSANNLMFSKLLDKPVWWLAWVWNGPAVFFNWMYAYLLGLILVWMSVGNIL